MSGFLVSVGDEGKIVEYLSRMGDLLNDMVSAYKVLADSQQNLAPSWKGEDAKKFVDLMNEYHEKSRLLSSHAQGVIDPALRMMRKRIGDFHGGVAIAKGIFS